MKPQTFLIKELLIKYGDVGLEYFILSKGSVKITVYNKGTDSKDPELAQKVMLTKYMGQGCGFGELALLYNDKRSATIEAVEVCETYTLDGTIFKTILIKSSIQKRSLQAGFLDKIKLFDSLDKFQKLKLVNGLQTMNLNRGEFIL
jgi:CRP-like cAMP-binding protein